MNLARPAPLILICVVMFGFGFMLVPLYAVFCEWAGINGKTSGVYLETDIAPTASERIVKVQFISNHNANLTWPFKPSTEQISVKIGEQKNISFAIENPTNFAVVAQAVPSVSPAQAAPYLHKIECFCFQQQDLLAGEKKDMPLVFFIGSDLPKHINKLTLSYTLFNVTPSKGGSSTKL